MSEVMLQTKNITRAFPIAGGEEFYALRGIDIEIPKGVLAILKGRSGSGKTTLLNIISALDFPTDGTVYLNENEISAMTESEREAFRRMQIGFIFQSVALIPIMSAYENVDFGLRLAGYQEDRHERVVHCLKQVGLHERMMHMPGELSGGEQQRVAIARAIAHKPIVIFADEPTGALDTNTGLLVVKLFKDLIEQEGITIVMTTHDLGIMELGDVIYEMEDGEIVGKNRK